MHAVGRAVSGGFGRNADTGGVFNDVARVHVGRHAPGVLAAQSIDFDRPGHAGNEVFRRVAGPVILIMTGFHAVVGVFVIFGRDFHAADIEYMVSASGRSGHAHVGA